MPEGTPASQTLSRGIRILEVLADARVPLTIDEIAARLEVHRSVAYRLLRTLEDHRLVGRDASGSVTLGARMAALAAGVAHDLQAEALPELTAIANELGMTCFLGVLDGDDCITLASIEPRHAIASVAQRPGARHPVTVGAPGKAILAQLRRRNGRPASSRPSVTRSSAPAPADMRRVTTRSSPPCSRWRCPSCSAGSDRRRSPSCTSRPTSRTPRSPRGCSVRHPRSATPSTADVVHNSA